MLGVICMLTGPELLVQVYITYTVFTCTRTSTATVLELSLLTSDCSLLQGTPQPLPGNKVKTSFMKSVPMSTYLVCFAVHQFDFVERTSARGIPVSLMHIRRTCFCWMTNCFSVCPSLQLRIYAQPTQLHTTEYAANTTKIIFDYFEEYFNMNYSISKLGNATELQYEHLTCF